jgi:Paraquat-inducible protein A
MYQRRIEASAVAKYSATTLEMSKNESTNAVADEHDQLHYNFDQYDEEDPYYRSMTPNDSTDQIDVDVERGMGPTSSTSLSDELDKPDQYNDVDLYLEPVTNGNVCSFDEVPDELSVLQSDANLEHDIEPQSNERQREPDDNHDASVFEPDNDNLDPSKTANDSDLEESTLDIEDHNFKPIFMSSDNVMKPLNDAQIKPVVQSDGEISDSAIESNANDFQAVIDRHEDDVNPVLELHDEILEPICLSADDRPKPSAVESDENLDSATETCEDHVQSSGKFLEPAIESNDGLATPIDSDKPPEPVPEVNDSESLMEQQLDVVSDQYDQQYLDSSTKEPNLNHFEFADKSLESVLIESVYEDLELPVMKKPSSQYLGSVSIEDLTAINRTDESVAAFIDHRVEKDSAMIEPSENKYSKESAFDTSARSMTEMVEQGLSEPEFMDAVQLENALLEVVGPEPVIVKPNLGDDEVPMDDAHDYEVTSNESNRRSESDNEFLQPRCYSKKDVLPAACSNSTATNDHNSNVLVEFEPDRKLQLPQQPVVDDSIVCFSTRDLILPDECFYSTSVAALGSDSLDSDYNDNDNDKFSKTMDSAAFMPGKNDDKVVALFQCIFYRAHHTGRHYADDGLVVPPTANHLLISVALASAVLFLAGSILPAFATESQGVVGIVIGLGGSSMVDHGIFSVSKILIEMTEYFNTTKDKIGLWSITILFVATTVLVPIVLVLLYLVRWFYPMTHKSSRGLGIWMEALEAWQYVEVFVVTILLSVWQLGDISEFLMNKQCDSFESFFATMTHFQILTPQEAQCFKLQPTVEIGTYILLGATILLAILRTWTTLAIRQVQYQQRFCYLTTFKPNTAEDAEMMAEDNAKDATALVNAIAPFPVLFTDQFRWLMVKA